MDDSRYLRCTQPSLQTPRQARIGAGPAMASGWAAWRAPQSHGDATHRCTHLTHRFAPAQPGLKHRVLTNGHYNLIFAVVCSQARCLET